MPAQPPLTGDQIAQLVALLLRSGMDRDLRALVLGHLDVEYATALPEHRNARQQIHADLLTLNTLCREERPIALIEYLGRTADLIDPRPEALELRGWADRLDQGAPGRILRCTGLLPTAPHCVGRRGILARLGGAFEGAPGHVALVGEPGIGKTTIARQLVWSWLERPRLCPFDLIVWVDARCEQGTDTIRRALAEALHRPDFDGLSTERQDAALALALADHAALIVVDDAIIDDAVRCLADTLPLSLLLVSTDLDVDFYRVIAVEPPGASVLAEIADLAPDPLSRDARRDLGRARTPLEALIIAELGHPPETPLVDALPADPAQREALFAVALFRAAPERAAILDVLDHRGAAALDALVDRRLVEPVPARGAQGGDALDALGYALSGTVRSAAGECVAPDVAARLRHAYIHHLRERVWRLLEDEVAPLRWWAALRCDLLEVIHDQVDDIVHAIGLGLADPATVDTAVDLAVGSIHFIWEAGRPRDRIAIARAVARALAERPDPDAERQPRCALHPALVHAWMAFDGLGWALQAQGRFTDALRAVEDGVALIDRYAERRSSADVELSRWIARYRLADLHRSRGALATARAELEQCWAGAPRVVAGGVARALGRVARADGQIDAAAQWFWEAFDIEHRGGRPNYAVRALVDLAYLALRRGHRTRARQLFDEAAALAPLSLSLYTQASIAFGLGRLARLGGDRAEAERRLAESANLYRIMGHHRRLAGVERERARLRRAPPLV